MSITALPTAPSRDMAPATFISTVDTWVAALAGFTTEANALQSDVNAKETTASSAASTATTKATEAVGAANTSVAAKDISVAAKDAAVVAQQAAEAAWDAFDDKYLGAKTSDPTLDNDGNPLVAGAFYINTVTGYIRVYTGTAWVQGIAAVAGVESVNALQGAVTLKTINSTALTGSGDIVVSTPTATETLVNKTLTTPSYTRDDDGTISGGTWVIDYANGPLIKATVGAAITSITLSNLPASGTAGHLKLMIVNPGAYTITFPSSWKFTKTDFTLTNFTGLGVTLPASGVVFMDLLTDDSGANVYVTISRN